MILFRGFLALIFLCVAGYALVVGISQGWDLFSVFFGDIASLSWSGNFNLDFFLLLSLVGTWIAWRHNFTLAGVFLALLTVFGGSMFVASYLLCISIAVNGDVYALLLGETRANTHRAATPQ